MQIIHRLLTAVTLAITTSSALAITYIVPNDRDLVKRAEAIVVGAAVSSHAELTANGSIVTIANFEVERTLKGQPGDRIDIVEPGGRVGQLSTVIPGSPRFEPGERYLVFLIHDHQGNWATYGFAIGQFRFVNDLRGRTIVTRGEVDEGFFGFDEGTWAPHVERLRGGPEFLSFVGTVKDSDSALASDTYFVDRSQVVFETFPEFRPKATAFVPHALFIRPDYLFAGNYRWQSTSITFDYCCASKGLQPGLDGPGAVAVGTANWHGAGAGIGYTAGVNNESATGGLPGLGRGSSDTFNAVLFNDPFNDFAANNVPAGVVGIGGISKSGFPNYSLGDGTPGGYIPTLEGDVVIAKAATLSGVTQSTFNLVLTHELGHTLGFRHSDGTSDPNSPANGQHCNPPASPCANPGQAVMASVIFSSLSGLQQYDLDAAQTVYGNGPVCNAPSISTQPASQSISLGSQAALTVAAAGTAPFTYQWFVGTSGTTTTPVGTNSTTFNPSPAATTSYWVRVTNSCNGVQFANSNTAVVTVTCTAPSAPAPAAVPSSITSGQSSTITETPTGSGPFTYQWYSGNSGITTSPIGGSTSNNSITVSPAVTTSYWVRVTGQCAPAADTPAVTVTVNPCVPPSAVPPFASPSSITNGQSSFVSESASGTDPLTYQWYSGNAGVTTSPIGGPGSNSFISVSPTTTTSYWVRVTGQCGSPSDSRETTVTVTCAPIGSGPFASPQTINNGQSSQLSFNAAGNGPFTIQWYQGNSGDTSNMISGATGTSTVVSPTVNTSYWVRVSAPCGSQDSNNVVVFVNGSICAAASITTHPASATIPSGSPVTLTVVAAGTAPLTYQWYTGDKGDTSNSISGATSASLIRSPTVTTKYWVRVTGCNNSTADSNTATITVSTCTPPSITTQPANVSAPIGTAATLKAVAAGTALHYQWYEGNKGNTTKTVGTDSSTFITDAVDFNNLYWVRITGQCGTADSNAATVTAVFPPRGHAVRH